MPRDLTQLGRDYGDFIIAKIQRLYLDDGESIAIEDLKAFETWNAGKMLAIENRLKGEGATEHDIGVWRAAYRDRIAPRTNERKAATF
jgi:hypothetical protein